MGELIFNVRQHDSQWILTAVILGRYVVDTLSKDQSIGKTSYVFSQKNVRNPYKWELNRYDELNPEIVSKKQGVEVIESKGESYV